MANLKKKTFHLYILTWHFHKSEKRKTYKRFKFELVSVSKVKKRLKQLKRKNAVGVDGLPSWLLKDCKDIIAEPLAHLIDMSLQTSTYPGD